jgi:2,3-diketo-5-methylthiopentyl-1-phosphate enolase
MIFTPKNKAIAPERKGDSSHALASYRVDKKIHRSDIFEEIAIGQTLGAWDERFVDAALLQSRVAKVMAITESENFLEATIAFPWELWHGELSWLLALVFGKMSFYPGVSLSSLAFEEGCFKSKKISGPVHSIQSLRRRFSTTTSAPLLMGILKPNVAMSAEALADLYSEVAHSGVHLVKDDEIRHDDSLETTLRRIEKVANRKAKENLQTLYVVHAPMNAEAFASLHDWSLKLANAGADALLVNVWTSGLGALQNLRAVTKLPLVAHPALAGAMGQGLNSDSIDPAVMLGTLMRAAGADLTLFPSPYGKIGLPKSTTQRISEACRAPWPANIQPTIPVPSAGIKPEHVALACQDFGQDFILNAGTAIFASGQSVADSAREFLEKLETFSRAQ